ncbi:HU family DNA-binding protein [Cupriavidus malaysiensis]|uniref:HU family DNA-binding protein n=1 Tax=Cupriavidus malaysiensis TaxID=367825 RepID=A0ABN4TX83_9BURK|nr:hypothetical protein [Cupriavidus malaysiensis]AOZ11184.1 hypothetical protein BKK80_35110 [Cupriavidus malaysiensis]
MTGKRNIVRRKRNMVRRIAEKHGLSQRCVERVMDDLKRQFINDIATTGFARWGGFGVFRVDIHRTPPFRSPRLQFRPAPELRDAVKATLVRPQVDDPTDADAAGTVTSSNP